MAKLFLSYAREDAAAAKKLVALLNRAGHEVWWDALIQGGVRYSELIEEALANADAVVVLWSARSTHSDWVKDEAAQGRDRHRLIPLSLDGTEAPLGFRQLQAIDLSRGRLGAAESAAIERAIASTLDQDVSRPLVGSRAVSRRKLLVGGAATVALAGGGVAVWQSGLIGPSAPDQRSIAVLPFRNLGGNPDEAYLSEGLTEEIRTALMRNPLLSVLAATSSNAARELRGDAKAVAGQLGVTYLLEGSVQRSSDKVAVAVNLTNGRSGFSEWSQQVVRPLGNLFTFESDIARMVSTAMSVRMATDKPAPGGTRNIAAYEAYLHGLTLYNLDKDEETDRRAKAYLEIAVQADPNFALARAGLSRVLSSIASAQADASELKTLYDQAIREARRATEIAPTLPQGQLALGYALFAGRLDVAGARGAYDAAYRYGQGNADILQFYAIYAVRARLFAKALSAIERALALDPLNPRAWRSAGSIDLASGRPAEAIERYDRGLALNPEQSNARALKGYALIGLERWPEAKASLESEKSGMFRLTGLAILGAKTGDRKLAEGSYAELVREFGDAALYQQAQVLAQWGRGAQAIDRLERARAVGDSGMVALVTDPFLAPLSREPRFHALAREIGFS